jgi:hypothetical protein
MKSFAMLSVLVFIFTGCATTKITETRTDKNTGEVVITETEQPVDFWESKNLKNHQENELKIQSNHTEAIKIGIGAIQENAVKRSSLQMTNTERIMANIIDQQSIVLLSLQPRPERGRGPSTATDFWGQNLIGAGNLLLNFYGIYTGNKNKSGDNSPSLEYVNAGRDLYINSNPTTSYSLTGAATFDTSGGGSQFSWSSTTNSGNTGSTIDVQKSEDSSLF